MKFRPIALVALTGLSMTLSSCLQWESTTTVNPDGTGKFVMNSTLDLGPLAALMQQQGGSGPKVKDDPGREMLLGMLANTKGVDVWSEAKTETGADGKIKIVASGYFKDVTKLKLGNPLEGMTDKLGAQAQGGGDLPDIGEIRSKKDAAGNWILEMPLTGAGADPKAPPVAKTDKPKMTAEEIDNKVQEARMSMATAKAMAEAAFANMKIEQKVEVAGKVTDPGLFSKVDDHTVKLELSFGKVFGAVEQLLNDDEFAKQVVQLQGGNPLEILGSGEPAAKEASARMIQGIFGKGEPRIVIKPGEPLFKYEEEAAKAKATQSPEVKALLKEAAEKSQKAEARPKAA